MHQIDLKPLLKRRRNPFLYKPTTLTAVQNNVTGFVGAASIASANQFLPKKWAYPLTGALGIGSVFLGGKVGAGFGGAAFYSFFSDTYRMLKSKG